MGMRVNCACARQVPALAPHALAKVIEAILWLAASISSAPDLKMVVSFGFTPNEPLRNWFNNCV